MKKEIKKSTIQKIAMHIFLILLAIIMIYPLVWLFFGSFKTNDEIFSSIKLLPESFNLDGFIQGWKGSKQVGFDTYMLNSILLTIPTVAFCMLSSSLVAYGFARFDFRGRKVLFAVMLSTMMLPETVIVIPRYMIFRNLGWLNTNLTFYIPAILATNAFYDFMIYQFFRGLPRDIDEAAMIDGVGPIGIFFRILLPLIKPAVITAGLLMFIWVWNDFFNSLIYFSSVQNYPVSLGLRMMVDADAISAWNEVMAMSVVCMIPPTVIYFLSQRYFVEGIVTSGMKD